nr:MAG TPA: hypothetical protein [Caudoviricetes sp.]
MMTYDKETRTVRIENGYWKPVAIFLRDGSEQVRGKKIGGYEILFELPEDKEDGANKATLRTPLGVRKVTIRATKKEEERDLFRITKTQFQVGEIAWLASSDFVAIDGLEALEYVLDKKGDKPEQIEDTWGWIEKFILRYARKSGLMLDPDDVYDEEWKAIVSHPDFEYGKDYSFLYSDVIQKAM